MSCSKTQDDHSNDSRAYVRSETVLSLAYTSLSYVLNEVINRLGVPRRGFVERRHHHENRYASLNQARPLSRLAFRSHLGEYFTRLQV